LSHDGQRAAATTMSAFFLFGNAALRCHGDNRREVEARRGILKLCKIRSRE
jgi:hypothetical protein